MFSEPLRHRVLTASLMVGLVFIAPVSAMAQAAKNAKDKDSAPASSKDGASVKSQVASGQNTYEELYLKYLDQARSTPPAPASWMSSLTSDPRAHHVNDLVTIRVVENLTATGTADATVTKSGSASVGLPSPLSKGIAKALPVTSDTKFQGAGGTTRAGAMTAIVTGRVTEVLPNGDMVVEGVREIQVNNDRQVVVLTGVVRPSDVQPGNVVSSASVGQLRIQCLGKGLIKDSLSPGWLIRILNKIF